MKLLQNILEWSREQIIGEVPKDSAICEFDCRRPECSEVEWQSCTRRLERGAEELMPAGRSTLEALVE